MKLPQLTNIGNWFPKLRPRAAKETPDSRPYRVAQIEVTSRCSTGCIFCPHDALVEHWVEGDLPIDLYREKIAPHLDWFDLVYLQGWGEPMLHPHLWEMLALAQEKGCRTGFTTNGARLKEEEGQRLIDLGVSMISVSFAGRAPDVHQSLRTNSDFTRLCHNFENLARRKQAQGAGHPWLELHFLMTRANLGEFPALVELAASLGADEVVATNLTYSPSLTLDKMHIFDDQPAPEDMQIIEEARESARRADIPLRIYPLQAEPNTLVCDADPVNTVYINHRGEVTPCVYLGLTVEGRIPRYYQGESHPLDALTFGNIANGLEQALRGKERAKFTEAFRRRNLSSSPLAMFSYMAGQSQEDELPPPPAPCRHCYKMLGV
jgi:MoaA/NifB/PqqE/SkfB family radical SAM enzyme